MRRKVIDRESSLLPPVSTLRRSSILSPKASQVRRSISNQLQHEAHLPPPEVFRSACVPDGEAMPTLAEFIEERYMPHALATKRSACWEQIIFRNHLLPAFGHVRLDQITRSAISLLIQEKVVAGYKPGTVNRILANLKTVLARAVEWEIAGLDKNVARQVKAIRDPLTSTDF